MSLMVSLIHHAVYVSVESRVLTETQEPTPSTKDNLSVSKRFCGEYVAFLITDYAHIKQQSNRDLIICIWYSQNL